MIERVMYLVLFYQPPKIKRKLRSKQKEQPEDACHDEANIGSWVLCLSWPEDFLFDARRGPFLYTHPAYSHTCTLASLLRVQLEERL
jgi:hypothetical protein